MLSRRKSLILVLSLVACGEAVTARNTTSNDVISMSRDAVSEPVSEPVSQPVADDGVLLGSAMLTDAVPITDSSAAPEPIAQPEVPMVTFTLRNGETLDHFAKWSGFPVEDIASFSGLSLDGDYPVGTVIQLPVDEDAASGIAAARADHWQRRLDGWLASRGGSVGTEFYTVRTGDSAWSIARSQFSVPMWVLEMYNPSVDLERLRPGQELMLPRLADVVVDAQPEIPEVVAPETTDPQH